MNTRIKKPYDMDVMQWCMRQALLRCDLQNAVVPPKKQFGMHHEEYLTDTLQRIGTYIEVGFNMYDNPLKHLRRFLPDFEWGFHQHRDVDALVLNIQCSDYVWLKDNLVDWVEGIVTAKRPHTADYHRVVFYPENDSLGRIESTWPVKELSAVGCKILVIDDWLKI